MVWTPAAPAPPHLCLEPAEAEVDLCRQLEEHILAGTVRIEMQGWNKVGPTLQPITRGGKSHATVVAGRYLVTHNHLKLHLVNPVQGDEVGYTGLTLRKANGEQLLENAPLDACKVIFADPETLVLEFLTASGGAV
jgi:hypothetical protein